MKARRLGGLALAAAGSVVWVVLSAGCADRPPPPSGPGPTAERALGFDHCGYSAPTLEVLRGAQAWGDWLQQRGLSAADSAASTAPMRWIVAAGYRSSAGYTLQVAPSAQPELLRIKVARAGGQGAVYAQVMTSPCLVMAAPDAHFRGVIVEDRNGVEQILLAD